MAKEEKPIHHMNPPTYKVPCGNGDKIFGEGHGASIYWHEVTCPDCLKIHKQEVEAQLNG